ncbi:MAG: hypothetical protein RLZZ597_3291, partial [Cyanobacteriota bacterium]
PGHLPPMPLGLVVELLHRPAVLVVLRPSLVVARLPSPLAPVVSHRPPAQGKLP